ncbi:enolase C-terminal domain-like protein [Sphingomonas lenta]|uniref:enolase C-terminal domain-like protein n=1 Tax=Sphingomonas lenta TaxID=1141887 RepID=UPI001FEBF230|nr:enolase C-terminal domain-like protein [Sphingomonas lenta]
MGTIITSMSVWDIRFPTSASLDGSDAMNVAPDYSMAYVRLDTNQPGLSGFGFTFTIGRGNDLCAAGIRSLRALVVGRSLDGITSAMGEFWRLLVGDSQLRWLGPEKGVVHLAAAAVVNAVWDLWGKQEDKPVWRLAADLSADHIVSLIDFTGITDAIAPGEAARLLKEREAGVTARRAQLLDEGFPAYTTSAGWLGYPDDKIRRLCAEAVEAGWRALKIKVGRDLEDDRRRCAIVRESIGPDRLLMIDANQVWEVEEAISWTRAMAEFEPYWIEEPVHPDDVLGHARIRGEVAPIRVATGEHVPNRIMFKQLLQADAIDVVQADACRLGGLNEAMAVMLLAAVHDKPICPHAGGVGLCENAQHLSMIDYLRFGCSMEGRMARRLLRTLRRQRRRGDAGRSLQLRAARRARGPRRDLRLPGGRA